MRGSLAILAAGLFYIPTLALARVYTIVNNCPQGINVYISGVSQGRLATGASITKTQTENWSGFIFTDANGGSATGERTTRAGFYGDNDMYYIVIDGARLNTGVNIEPQSNSTNGFCGRDLCDNGACNSVYNQPPTGFPPVSDTPPTPPVYACPGDNIGYKVTFCPSGGFPPARLTSNAIPIHPNGNKNKCLDVRGNVLANGTPVQIYDCNGSAAQQWFINAATTAVQLGNTGYCLDAGSAPASGVKMKIWQCYDSLAAQTWYYTEDKRLVAANSPQCLDLTNGVLTNSNQVQTWICTDNNNNQVWTWP